MRELLQPPAYFRQDILYKTYRTRFADVEWMSVPIVTFYYQQSKRMSNVAPSYTVQTTAYPPRTQPSQPFTGGYTAVGTTPECNGPCVSVLCDQLRCNLGPDGLYDWAYSRNISCTSGVTQGTYCSQPDPGFCPFINSPTPPPVNWVTNDDNGFPVPRPLSSGRMIQCDYPTNVFTTELALNTWLEDFSSGLDSSGNPTFSNDSIGQRNQATWVGIIMPFYCTQSSGDCPADIYPVTGPSNECPIGFSGCTILHSNSPGYCTAWYNALSSQSQTEVINSVCQNNVQKCFSDCLCANRTFEPVYESFAGVTPSTLDFCWYKPCQSSQNYYIPPEQTGTCPMDVCADNLFTVGGTNPDIPFSQSQPLISCELGVPQPATFWETYWWVVTLAIIFVILLILAVVILAMR